MKGKVLRLARGLKFDYYTFMDIEQEEIAEDVLLGAYGIEKANRFN